MDKDDPNYVEWGYDCGKIFDKIEVIELPKGTYLELPTDNITWIDEPKMNKEPK
jgi:hypothetical protein